MKFSELSKIETVNGNSRSFPSRFVFAEARGLQTGEGPMVEVQLTRIAVCRAAQAPEHSSGRADFAARFVRPKFRACFADFFNIGRSPHIPWRAVNGGQGFSFLSGLASGASRPPLRCRGARPSFARPAAGPCAGLAAPDRPSCTLPAPAPPHRAILEGRGGVLRSQIARTVGVIPNPSLRTRSVH